MFFRHKISAQSYPINHNLCKHIRTENDKNQEREIFFKRKINGIIVIICIYCHCWGLIIVYPYYIQLNVFFT